MPVIEAQCASILVPHDHRHINQKRTFTHTALLHKYMDGQSRAGPH